MLKTPEPESILRGDITDYCCVLTEKSLERLGLSDRRVVIEACVRRFPGGLERGILYGMSDVAAIARRRGVIGRGMSDGDEFFADEPVLLLEGRARDLAAIRSSITGVLAFGSSYVSRMHRIVTAAAPRPVAFFGLRKIHPAHIYQYLECAYVSGMSTTAAVVPEPMEAGTREDCQEHFVNIVASSPEDGWRSFLELPADLHALYPVLDNMSDPVAEVRWLAREYGPRLPGVLVDVDHSRRGDLPRILRELRWTLHHEGAPEAKIALTGGVNVELVEATKAEVASYGVGVSALAPELLDFSLQIVEVDGRSRSKLGVLEGRSEVLVCRTCAARTRWCVQDDKPTCCGRTMECAFQDVPVSMPTPSEVREKLAARHR